jgi:hypothetical protein
MRSSAPDGRPRIAGMADGKPLVRRIDDASGRVRLFVRGFAVQRLVSPDEIADAIQWLPGFHLEGLREVIYAPTEALAYPSLGGGRPFSECAEYVQRERTIFVYRLDNEALFWHVLYHEIGHHVYFLVIDSSAKKHWAGDVHRSSACPTSYAYSSPAEDFAECYALYARHTRMLSDFPEKSRFMQDRVFSPSALKLRDRRTLAVTPVDNQ